MLIRNAEDVSHGVDSIFTQSHFLDRSMIRVLDTKHAGQSPGRPQEGVATFR